ncbi:MAG TPA: hypothetical protein VFW40_13095 [Capsulimonadaceae bacterium]|nr:hypothetical protein [Capsulimonadaceae bacterium]
MSDEQTKPTAEEPADTGRKGGAANESEPGGHAFGESFTTNSGLANSTGIGRKDTPDAEVCGEEIIGGPDTGTATVSPVK